MPDPVPPAAPAKSDPKRKWLARALGYTKPRRKDRTRNDPAALGETQKARADERLKKLSADDKKAFKAMVDSAASKPEKSYLLKGLASGYSMAELKKFSDKIRGKDEKWLNDNLHATGSSTGKGVKQQWAHSCNATTVQAVRAELDPVYALKLHEQNTDITTANESDPTRKNKRLGREQKQMLESNYAGTTYGAHKGTAVARDQISGGGGGGRWADDLLNNLKDVTGLEYAPKSIAPDYGPDKALADMDKQLLKGNPVPIVIGQNSGDTAHYVLVTKMEEGPPKKYVIHDPWDGITVKRTSQEIIDGKINLAGHSTLAAFELPSEAKKP